MKFNFEFEPEFVKGVISSLVATAIWAALPKLIHFLDTLV